MRKMWSKWLAVAVVAVSTMATLPAEAQGSVSLQVFYDELQPYGTWVDHGRYGYAWMPNAGSDFVPYGSNGYWVQTSYGNTWVSNYSWGWAPFHYGRWFYDDFYGWLWVPDTTWGPAWVAWRSGGGYYGWAPLTPGLGVSVSVGYYDHIPQNYWNFVPYRYVMYHQVYRHCVSRPRVVNVMHQTTVIVNNNYYDHQYNGQSNGRGRNDGRDRATYFTGPSRSEIEKRNGERVPTYELHERQAPGAADVSRTSVSMYKPVIEQSTRRDALPSHFTRDDAQGRSRIEQMRTSQTLERTQTRESFDNNPRTMRRDGTAAGQRSDSERNSIDRNSMDRNSRDPRNDRNQPSRDVGDMPRDRTPDFNRGTDNLRERANRSNMYDRSNTNQRTDRDAEFNRMQNQRESELLKRQQAESQRRDQFERNEQRQRERIEQQQRSFEMPRQGTPARESNQFQQRSQRLQQISPARQGQQQMNTPSHNSGQQPQRSGQKPMQHSGQRSAQPARSSAH